MDREPQELDSWLEQLRRELPPRPLPEEAIVEMAQGAVLIDTRTFEQRMTDGAIPGALVIGLNVLPWRCNPSSPNRDPRIEPDYGQRLLILCNQGYSSSVAAHSLLQLGMTNVTDIDGGFQAWVESGQPYYPPSILQRLGAKLVRYANR